jgi:DNA-binding XRE family transcriptional regulator
MAKLSKIDAAKAAGVSRQTLYNYVKDGRLSVDPDGLIDTADLLRAGFSLHRIDSQTDEHRGHELTPSPEDTQPDLTPASEHIALLISTLQREHDFLHWELADAKAEKARLLGLLESQQRLLEAGPRQRAGLWTALKAWVAHTLAPGQKQSGI